jgi:Ca-activated chloride channel family protein
MRKMLIGWTLSNLMAISHPAQDKPIRLEANLVVIEVIVMDKNGNYVRDLKPEDFAIFEDGQRQQVAFFEANQEAALTRPLAVVFALDISGSITPEEVIKQREAALSFIRLVRPDSVFAVIAFNQEIRLMQDFTSDPQKVSRAFDRIRETGGATRLFASIDKSISMLKRAPRYRDGRRLRRVVIVITDGYDSADTVNQADLIRRANEAEVTVYSITLPSYTFSSDKRAPTLLDISEIVPRTGGADFSADQKDFTLAFKAIAEEIRASYTLAYYPPERSRRDGRTHKIRIEVNRPGLIVRASRQEYQSGAASSRSL